MSKTTGKDEEIKKLKGRIEDLEEKTDWLEEKIKALESIVVENDEDGDEPVYWIRHSLNRPKIRPKIKKRSRKSKKSTKS